MADEPVGTQPIGAGPIGGGSGEAQPQQSIQVTSYIRTEVSMDNTGQVQANTSLKITHLIQDQNFNPVSLAAAVSMLIYIRKPTGESIPKDAQVSTDGTDGLIYCILDAADLDLIGDYVTQAFVEMQDGLQYPSSQVNFSVAANIFDASEDSE